MSGRKQNLKTFNALSKDLVAEINAVIARLNRMTPADYAAPDPLEITLRDVQSIEKRFNEGQRSFKAKVDELLNAKNFTPLTTSKSTNAQKSAAKNAVKTKVGIARGVLGGPYKFKPKVGTNGVYAIKMDTYDRYIADLNAAIRRAVEGAATTNKQRRDDNQKTQAVNRQIKVKKNANAIAAKLKRLSSSISKSTDTNTVTRHHPSRQPTQILPGSVMAPRASNSNKQNLRKFLSSQNVKSIGRAIRKPSQGGTATNRNREFVNSLRVNGGNLNKIDMTTANKNRIMNLFGSL